MKNNVLVVGGTGFIGYHLIKFLKKKNFNITSISTNPPKKIRKINNVEYIIFDISKKKNFNKIKKKFHYVVNLGGYVDHSDKILTYRSHYLGCVNLVNFFEKKKIKSFIQIGSSLEYGKTKSPQIESKKNQKTFSVYSRCKLLATNYLLSKNKLVNFPSIVLRGFQVYGPRQDENRLISYTISNCLKDNTFDCSAGKQFRDFLYVDDFILAIYKAMKNKKAIGNIINIGYGKPIKIKNLILLIKEITKRGNPKFDRIALRKDEIIILYPSIRKAFKILKWKPRIKFLDGLKRTINYYKKILK